MKTNRRRSRPSERYLKKDTATNFQGPTALVRRRDGSISRKKDTNDPMNETEPTFT